MRLHHGHSFVGGIVAGAALTRGPVGVLSLIVAGVAIAVVTGRARRLAGRLGDRVAQVVDHFAPAPASTGPLYCECERPIIDVDHDDGCRRCGRPVYFGPGELDDVERERERRVGIRQGQAAGVRAAARAAARDEARRRAARESLDDFAGELRADSLRRAGVDSAG